MSSTFYIAHPFIYQQGQPFAPSQPSSTGIVWGWFWGFTGTGKGIDGILLVAPGYEARWYSDLWSRSLKPVAMAPLSREAALDELRTIQRLLGHQIINGDATLKFSLGPTYPLYVRIEVVEQAAVHSFLDSGIACLDTGEHGLPGVR